MVAVGMNLSSTFDTIAGSSKLRLPKRSASAAAVVAFVVAALFPPPPYRVLRGDRVSHASRRASETVPSRQVHPQPTGSSRRRSPRSDRSLLARDYKPSATRTYPNAGLALPAPASSGRILRAAGLITTLSEPTITAISAKTACFSPAPNSRCRSPVRGYPTDDHRRFQVVGVELDSRRRSWRRRM